MEDAVYSAGIEWLTALLAMQGLEAKVTAEVVEDEAGHSCWLTISEEGLTPDQVHILIGEGGAVLDSLQYLANTTLNLGKNADEQHAFTLELGGYRIQRLGELKAMALAAAEQVLASGQEYELKGLSSAERRQLHHVLKAQDGLSTFSRGKEPDRRLVVCLESEVEGEA